MRKKLVRALVAAWALLAAVRCEAQSPGAHGCPPYEGPPLSSVKAYPVAWGYPGKVGDEHTDQGRIHIDASTQPITVSAKDQDPFYALAAKVFGVLLRMPTLSHPCGFDVWTFASRQSGDIDGSSLSQRPRRIAGYMCIRTPTYLQLDDGIKNSLEADAGDLTVESNRLSNIAASSPGISMREDEQGKFWFPPPRPSGTSPQGYPMWGNYLVVTHRTAPFFVPVSQERILNYTAANAQKKVAEFEKELKDLAASDERMRKVNPELYKQINAAETFQEGQQRLENYAAFCRQVVSRSQGRIAGMTPEQRTAPAHLKPMVVGPGEYLCAEDELAGPDDPQGQAVVQFNPDFFDWTLPPAAPQILVVYGGRENEELPDGTRMFTRLWRELDWEALEALLPAAAARPASASGGASATSSRPPAPSGAPACRLYFRVVFSANMEYLTHYTIKVNGEDRSSDLVEGILEIDHPPDKVKLDVGVDKPPKGDMALHAYSTEVPCKCDKPQKDLLLTINAKGNGSFSWED